MISNGIAADIPDVSNASDMIKVMRLRYGLSIFNASLKIIASLSHLQ